MEKAHLFFQYCPKLVVFSEDWSSVLLACRYGEADYDGTFSFIGGKMETSDADIAAALKREKTEEIGANARVTAYIDACNDLLFRKKDGTAMIVPHFAARYTGGDIRLNPEEYSEFRWVAVGELESLEPKIANIPDFAGWVMRYKDVLLAGPTAEL